jgi:hypothetical protein
MKSLSLIQKITSYYHSMSLRRTTRRIARMLSKLAGALIINKYIDDTTRQPYTSLQQNTNVTILWRYFLFSALAVSANTFNTVPI